MSRYRSALPRLCVLLAGLAACAPPAPRPPAPRAPHAPGERPVVLPMQPPAMPREFRGVWIATVGNLNWPSRPGLSVDSAKAELRALLNRAEALNLNAVVFQIRPAADAFYISALEPWSSYLTGTMGQAPPDGFDPLAFAIREAHARGMELHAWVNPYRAGFTNGNWQASPDHITRRHPELVRRYGSYLWLDPGLPQVREHTLAVVRDVVRRYDVDGIQIDDYFYPYPEKDATGRVIPFPDDATYDAYRLAGGSLARADWRRENVNRLVRALGEAIHGEKPWVKFGISPFGLYRDGVPAPGLDAYADLYADARKWLNAGWVDYMAPQLYWLTDSGRPFAPVLAWWVGENTQQRHIWPGIYDSRVGTADGWTIAELQRQIELTRRQPGASGNIHFNASFLRGRTALADTLRLGLYAEPALVPASPWLGDGRPAAPTIRIVDGSDGSASIRITPANGVPVRFWTVRCYDRTRWVSSIVDGDATSDRLPEGLERPFWVLVTGISRTGMEGAGAVASSDGR